MRRNLPALVVLALLLASCALAHAKEPVGIGVLGDSYSDEYQFYPPHRSTARNWVEILAATRRLDFGPFSDKSRGEPRNQGFAYNWARSDATTDDMIRTGQHTGLAEQVVRGKVQIVCVFIGGNDFINAMKSNDPRVALEDVLPLALANYRTAVRTVLEASPEVKLVVATLPDIRHLPEFEGPVRSGQISTAVADAFTRAIAQFNAQVRSLAADHPRVALLDCDRVAKVANLVSQDRVLVAGRWLDRKVPKNDLNHFFLADVRHPGTLGQGLMAKMFIETVNARFDAGIPPLGGEELLAFASSLQGPPKTEVADRSVSLDRRLGPSRVVDGSNGR